MDHDDDHHQHDNRKGEIFDRQNEADDNFNGCGAGTANNYDDLLKEK